MDPKIPGGERAVRTLLRKRRRPSDLERDELAQRLRTSYSCTTACEALDRAIERGLHGYDGRLRTIIRRCDVEGELTQTVARELYLSPRQFFRSRSQAVAAVAAEIERAVVAEDVQRTFTGPAVMLAAIDLAPGDPARALDLLEHAFVAKYTRETA